MIGKQERFLLHCIHFRKGCGQSTSAFECCIRRLECSIAPRQGILQHEHSKAALRTSLAIRPAPNHHRLEYVHQNRTILSFADFSDIYIRREQSSMHLNIASQAYLIPFLALRLQPSPSPPPGHRQSHSSRLLRLRHLHLRHRSSPTHLELLPRQ